MTRSRRAVPDPEALDIGVENSRGTNIQHIALDRSDRLRVSHRQPWGEQTFIEHPLAEGTSGKKPSTDSILPAGMPTLLGVSGLILLVCLVVILVVLLLRRKRKEKKNPPYATSSCSAYGSGSSSKEMAGMRYSRDSSEV